MVAIFRVRITETKLISVRIGARRLPKKNRASVSCVGFLIALWFTAPSSIIWRTDLLAWPTWSVVDKQNLVFHMEKSNPQPNTSQSSRR